MNDEARAKKLAYLREYRRQHKDHIDAQIQAWKDAHPDKVREYRERPTAVKRRREYNAQYRDQHQDELRTYIRSWRDAYQAREGHTYHNAWYAENRLDVVWRTIFRKYGITPQDYDDLLQKQNFVCAMCELPPKRFVIDHDHATGLVRGLLCDKCNHLLHLLDNQELHDAGVRYLARHLGFWKDA